MQTDADFVSASLNQSKDQAIPMFFMKDVKNNFNSNAAGHPVYDKKEFVRVIIPGDRNSIPEREVREQDKSRWAKQYVAFKNGLVLSPDGLPLEEWPLIDKNMIEHLKHWNIRSVEQLANLNDMHLQKLGMGARDLRSKAIVYLEQARDMSGVSRVVAENDALKARLASMEEQIREIGAAAAAKAAGGGEVSVPAAPAATGMSPEALQQMIASSVAAAMAAAAPPKNKGGRPRKSPAPDHELPPEGE